MSAFWGDLVARVRGLSGHLLGRARLISLSRSRDLIQLAAALDTAYGPTRAFVQGPTAEQLELAARRIAALYMRIIARWCGDRVTYVAPLFLDEDRRSIRALVRGSLIGSPNVERLAGLIPTPALPEKALEELARRDAREVVELLVLWGHPLAAPLQNETRRAQPDPLRLDLLLNTEYAARCVEAVRRAPLGNSVRHDLLTLVRQTIDIENASTALQLGAEQSSTAAAQFFIPGGKLLDRTTFLAAATGDAARARMLLRRAFEGTDVASIFAAAPVRSFEDATLVAELRRTAHRARLHPLGAAPLIQFLVRLRAELRDLRYIVWRIALGAPPVAPDALVTT